MLDFEYLVKKTLDRIYYPSDYNQASDYSVESYYLDILTKRLEGDEITKEDYGQLILKENNKDHLNQFMSFVDQINIEQVNRLNQNEYNEPLTEILHTKPQEELLISDHITHTDDLTPTINPTHQKPEIDSKLEKGSFLYWIKSKELRPNSMHETIYKIQPNDDTPEEHHLATKSIQKDDQIISESLAMIHAKQGDIESAINMLEQLSLKKPEKKLYFAHKIDELKKNK